MDSEMQRQLAANVQRQSTLTLRQYHEFEVTSFGTPTSCDVCGKMLLGLWKQGYSCRGCNQMNVHESCMHAMVQCHNPNADTCRVGGARGAVVIPGSVGGSGSPPAGMGAGQQHQVRTPFGAPAGGNSPIYR